MALLNIIQQIKNLLAEPSNAITALGGTPSTQAFGDSASAGTSTAVARADHKHKMPAAPSGGIGTGVGIGQVVELTAQSGYGNIGFGNNSPRLTLPPGGTWAYAATAYGQGQGATDGGPYSFYYYSIFIGIGAGGETVGPNINVGGAESSYIDPIYNNRGIAIRIA